MKSLFAFCFLVLFLVAQTAQAEPPFRFLGRLRGGDQSEAVAISGNGFVVAGVSEQELPDGTSEDFAFRWTPAKNIKSLGTLGGSESEATGISQDGSVIVGGAENVDGLPRAFRWTSAGMIDLSSNADESSFATSVSSDGQVVVGWVLDEYGQEQPFRWSPHTGMQRLSTFGGLSGCVRDANHDGSVVVGFAQNQNGATRAFRWTLRTGLEDLGDLGGGSSAAYAISPNGAFVVGLSFDDVGLRAFRWTRDGGMQDLGGLVGGRISELLDVSGDGQRVIGNGNNRDGVRAAALWTPRTGWLDLNFVFSRYIPREYHLATASAISADGRYIVGRAITGRNKTIAFRLDTHVSMFLRHKERRWP